MCYSHVLEQHSFYPCPHRFLSPSHSIIHHWLLVKGNRSAKKVCIDEVSGRGHCNCTAPQSFVQSSMKMIFTPCFESQEFDLTHHEEPGK